MERTETETLDTGVLMDADSPDKPVTAVCENCNAELTNASAIYCPQCGHHIRGVKHYDAGSESLSANIKPLLVFFILDLLLTTASHIDSLVKNYSNLFVFELLSAILTIPFVIYSWSSLKHLFGLPKFDTNLILLIPGTIISSVIVNAIITKLNIGLYNKEYVFYPMYEKYNHAKLLMILSIALYPAIFEELGFRAFFQTSVSRFTSMRNAVIISAIAFSIGHFSLISLFWLFPFSLTLGYLRARYHTIWYGVMVHFLFNATTCAIEWYQYGVL